MGLPYMPTYASIDPFGTTPGIGSPIDRVTEVRDETVGTRGETRPWKERTWTGWKGSKTEPGPSVVRPVVGHESPNQSRGY